MKKIHLTFGLLGLGLGIITLAGCPAKNDNPTTPNPPAPTNTSIPSATPTSSPTPTPTTTITGTPTPSPTTTITGTPTLTATNTSTATVTDSPTATASATPTATFVCTGASGNVGLTTTTGVNTTTSDHMYVTRYQFTQNSRVTDMQVVACLFGGGSETVNVGIYSDVAGSPGTLVSPVASQTSTDCSAPTVITFPGGGVALPAGYYWLAVGSPSETYYPLTGGGTNIASYGAGSGSIPSTFPTSLTFSYTASPELSADWVCP